MIFDLKSVEFDTYSSIVADEDLAEMSRSGRMLGWRTYNLRWSPHIEVNLAFVREVNSLGAFFHTNQGGGATRVQLPIACSVSVRDVRQGEAQLQERCYF